MGWREYGLSQFVNSHFVVCEDLRRSRWENLDGIYSTFVPHVGLRSSIPLVALFPVKDELVGVVM
jgi:hypothetical protein